MQVAPLQSMGYGTQGMQQQPMYAAPQQQQPMYMPQTQSYLPQQMPTTMQMAAPQQTSQSIIAGLQQQTAQFVPAAPQPFNMQQPVSLTQGMPTAQMLEAERVAYERALDAQLKKQSDATLAEAAIKKKMLEQQALSKKAEFALQVEEQLKMQSLTIDQQAQNEICGLTEAAITQKTSREEAAAVACADYTKKKALEDYSVKSYELQKGWFDKEAALTTEYQRVMQAGSRLGLNTPAQPSVQIDPRTGTAQVNPNMVI